MEHPKARCCLFERFGESPKHESRHAFGMEKPLETASVGSQIGWGKVSGKHQGEANSMSWVDGDSDMALGCRFCGVGVSEKERVHLCQHFCLAESCPLALALLPKNSIPPCVSLMPFKFLPQHQNSERVSLSKSMHRPFKRNYLGFQKPFVSLSYNPYSFL